MIVIFRVHLCELFKKNLKIAFTIECLNKNIIYIIGCRFLLNIQQLLPGREKKNILNLQRLQDKCDGENFKLSKLKRK